MEEVHEEYVTTADGRQVKLLENPLPVPKKHVKREMKFDFEYEDDRKKGLLLQSFLYIMERIWLLICQEKK